MLHPIYEEIDLDISPLEAYSILKNDNFSFFLDSARTHPLTGRYSFIGIDPFLTFKAKGNSIEIESEGGVERFGGNPFVVLKDIFNNYRVSPVKGVANFAGGAVGYFSYECLHYFEQVPRRAADDLLLPDIFLIFVDTVTVFDHVENKIKIIAVGDDAEEKKERICEKLKFYTTNTSALNNLSLRRALSASEGERSNLKNGIACNDINCDFVDGEVSSNFTRREFESIVKKAKRYIRAGDIYQANLSHRFWTKCDVPAFELYKALRQINPSSFASFLDFGELKIVGSSPERLLKVEGRDVQTRPIAGTRPRGENPEEDLEKSLELILSDKERAEHIMLVDLERNDLGRVCEYATVKVNELMALEEYSHVIHIVSNVQGRLKDGFDRFDLIRAAFPGGTITGCPKVRCMQIIDELEPVARGPYTGGVGYLSFNGDMDLNIVIRTFVIKGRDAYVQVGAGIVADSDPALEYDETLYKAQALLKALKVARQTCYIQKS